MSISTQKIKRLHDKRRKVSLNIEQNCVIVKHEFAVGDFTKLHSVCVRFVTADFFVGNFVREILWRPLFVKTERMKQKKKEK